MSGVASAKTVAARALRRAETGAERKLWGLLRGRKLAGAKFRRQQPIGPYFVDFYCDDARLVIEADGAPHYPRPLVDMYRDAYLRALGLRILRFENDEILTTPDRVLTAIQQALTAMPPPTTQPPLPQGEGVGGEDL
jgi:very-short-patch-repair endonuclease